MKKLVVTEKRTDKNKKKQHRRRTIHGYTHNYAEIEGMNSDSFSTKTPQNTTGNTRKPLQIISASKTSSNLLFSASEPQSHSIALNSRTSDAKSVETLLKSKSKLLFVSTKCITPLEARKFDHEEKPKFDLDVHLDVDEKEANVGSYSVDCQGNTRKKTSDLPPARHTLVSSCKSRKLEFVVKDSKKSCAPHSKQSGIKISSKDTQTLHGSVLTNCKDLSLNLNDNNLQNTNTSSATISDLSELKSEDNVESQNNMIDVSDMNKEALLSSEPTCDSISDDELSNSIFSDTCKVANLPSSEVDADSPKTLNEHMASKRVSSKLKTFRKSASSSLRKSLQEARISALKNEVSSNNKREITEKSSPCNHDAFVLSSTTEHKTQSQFPTKSQKTKDWMHLFEEPFPRRSPRLRSLPKQDPIDYELLLDNLSPLTSRENTKRRRSKSIGTPKTTAKKVSLSKKMVETTDGDDVDVTLRNEDADFMPTKTQSRISVHIAESMKEHKDDKASLKRTMKGSSTCSKDCNKKKKVAIDKEGVGSFCSDSVEVAGSCSSEETHFPKPKPELSKPGGPFNAVVDFCLPDKDFVKLKLAKIKGAQFKVVNKMNSDETTIKQRSSTVQPTTGAKEAFRANKEEVDTCLDFKNTCIKQSTESPKSVVKQQQSQESRVNTRNSDLSDTMMVHNSDSENCLSESILEPLLVTTVVHNGCEQIQSENDSDNCLSGSILKPLLATTVVHNGCEQIQSENDSDNCLSGSILKPLLVTTVVHNGCEQIQSFGDDENESGGQTSSLSNNVNHGNKDCHQRPILSDKRASFESINMNLSCCSPKASCPSLSQGTCTKLNGVVIFSKDVNDRGDSELKTEKSPSDDSMKVVKGTEYIPSSQGSQSISPKQTFLKGLLNYNDQKSDRTSIDTICSSTTSLTSKENQRHCSTGGRKLGESNVNINNTNLRLTDGSDEKVSSINQDTTSETNNQSLHLETVPGSSSTNDSEEFIIEGCGTNKDCDGCGLTRTASHLLYTCSQQVTSVEGKRQDSVMDGSDKVIDVTHTQTDDVYPIPTISLPCTKVVDQEHFGAIGQILNTQSTHCEDCTPYKETVPSSLKTDGLNDNTSTSANFADSSKTESCPSEPTLGVEGSFPLCSNTEELSTFGGGSFPLCSNTEEFDIKHSQSIQLSVGNSPTTIEQSTSNAKSTLTGYHAADHFDTGINPSRMSTGEVNIHVDSSTKYQQVASLILDNSVSSGKGNDTHGHAVISPTKEPCINVSPKGEDCASTYHSFGSQSMVAADCVTTTPCGTKVGSSHEVGYSVRSQATEPSIADTTTPCGTRVGSSHEVGYSVRSQATEPSIADTATPSGTKVGSSHEVGYSVRSQATEPSIADTATPCSTKVGSSHEVGYSVRSQATEPSIADTATPSGKANIPKRTSIAALPCDEVENIALTPILMQACLQHENSECSTVQSISMFTYNVSGHVSKKREVIAVCLPYWIVVWSKTPGQEWTILKTWTLELADSEMFQKVEFLPAASHLVLFAGGTFLSSNGRIYGYSEKTCYDFQLEYDDLDAEVSFNSVCVLSNNDGDMQENDIEVVVAGASSSRPLVDKWTLDSLCLNAKSHSALPLPNKCSITSLSAVDGSSYLLIGLTPDNLIIWNHQSCCLVKVIPMPQPALHSVEYLHATMEMGLLFLTFCQRSMQKNGCPYYLYALNPTNNMFKCLSSFSSNSVSNSFVRCGGGSGQYMALGQDNGSVCLWNMATPQTQVNFPVFQGAVDSISFHPTRPIVAFGGGLKSCVHLYSLS